MAVNVQLLEKKYNDSMSKVQEAFERYGVDNVALAWTGGKDSTLVTHIVHSTVKKMGIKMPRCFCIDEGDVFDEIRAFLAENEPKFDVKVEMIHNSDVSKAAGGKLRAMVKVADLNERNRREIERLGFEEAEFPYEPESFVGNHLMKTATLNVYLYETKVKGFFEGIRWDEQGSRASEHYFSPRPATEYSPEHMRICPILHFTERDVWDAHFHFNIPICPLYKQGYRSLGARITTRKTTDVPAWDQDLENTSERGGRNQDKEGLMAKLRNLGYM
ncbi:MAG: phosphoadenosine phosphosulfate reductase family protein [Phycisphaerales bacterium]|nr:phosphoadenosine phosphosulfate reductase family protein [Phycisphaerales bacterium]